jgi:hypothetical protein
MTDFCEIHREDWGRYVLGSLDPGVRGEMSAHLGTGCLECAKQFAKAQIALTTGQHTDNAPDLVANYGSEAMAPLSARPRWKFWSVAPWVLAAVFFGLFVVAERAHLNLQKQMLDARQLNPMTNHIVHENHAAPAGNDAKSENDQDLQATIEQLRGSLDQANQQIADAQRDSVRFQTDLKTAQLQIASLEGGVRGSEESRVKAETDAASIRMQLSKAQDDAHRAATLAAQNQQMMKLLESPRLQQFSLAAVSPAAGDASARVVWDNDSGLMLLAHDLPDLAENHVYQLWLMATGRPSMVSAGTVQVDSRGRGIAYVAPGDLHGFGAVAVTDEPSAGSTVPHGPQILFGKE